MADNIPQMSSYDTRHQCTLCMYSLIHNITSYLSEATNNMNVRCNTFYLNYIQPCCNYNQDVL